MTPIDLSCANGLCVRILPHGATLAAVRVQPQGRNLVLGFQDPKDHLTIPAYAGGLVGPIANRITRGCVVLVGQTYQMECNEDGRNALHSGATGIHAHLWAVQDQTSDAVTLTTTLADGAGGLPGNRDMTAHYSVNGMTLRLEITAQTDRATPMNIAAHPYWNLDGTPDVCRHQLLVNADHYTPTDTDNLPTGAVSPTAQSIFDYSVLRRIPRDPALDINFCLATSNRAAPHPAATVTGLDGTQLDIATTAPGLQVYNGAHLPALPGVRDDGSDLRPYGGLALEPQYWPDAPNQPEFPQITLLPGSLWRQITTYQLTPPGGSPHF